MTPRIKTVLLAGAFLAVAAAFFLGLTAWMTGGLHFDLLNTRSDAFSYWRESLTWGLPFHPHHPPGYPILIAAVHALVGGLLSPLALLQSMAFLFLAGGALIAARIAARNGLSTGWIWAALIFVAWPFVGSLYAVYPQIDACVLFLLFAGVALALSEKWIAAAAVWEIAMWIHPVAWIVAPVLLVSLAGFWLWESRRPSSAKRLGGKTLLAALAVGVLPVLLLWIWQTAVTHDPLWTLSSIFKEEVVSRGASPILDGWIGTLAGGGIGGYAKVAILAAIVLLAVYIVVRVAGGMAAEESPAGMYRRIVSLAAAAVILLLALALNQHEIWAVVRFSKILLIPLILFREKLFGFVPPKWRTPALAVVVAGGFLTQIAYAWYMASVFYAG